MILSDSTWYSKVYFFIEDWWASAKGKSWAGDKSYHVNTNLCEFMRAFIFKLPILLLMQVILYGIVLFTFILFPMSYLGFTFYAIGVLAIAGVIGMWIGARSVNLFSRGKQTFKEPKSEPSFWDIVKLWIEARHDAICPLMTFKEDKDNV